jgi:hypothetical protein
MISKTKHNDQKEQQELSDEEEYQTDQQYEQERFTDEYSKYFEMMRIKQIDSLMTITKISQIS